MSTRGATMLVAVGVGALAVAHLLPVRRYGLDGFDDRGTSPGSAGLPSALTPH